MEFPLNLFQFISIQPKGEQWEVVEDWLDPMFPNQRFLPTFSYTLATQLRLPISKGKLAPCQLSSFCVHNSVCYHCMLNSMLKWSITYMGFT